MSQNTRRLLADNISVFRRIEMLHFNWFKHDAWELIIPSMADTLPTQFDIFII